MAYEAIIEGARGLMFFGGHMTEVCVPEDAAAGWNWSFWRQVLRPLVRELTSPELHPALIVNNDSAEREAEDCPLGHRDRRPAQQRLGVPLRDRGQARRRHRAGQPRGAAEEGERHRR